MSAHPDDAEIGCGGILAKYRSQGFKVGIVDLTDGEPTPYTASPEERIAESKESGRTLGLSNRLTLTLPNRRLFDNFESRIALAKVLRQLRPKLVLSGWGQTPLASPDHYQAQLITESGVFYSRLSKWEEYFDSLAPHRVNSLFYYITLRENPLPAVNLVVDITNTFSTKMEALKSYKSQFRANPKQPEGVAPWIEAMGRYYGHLIEKKYGEPLISPKVLELERIEKLLDGPYV